MSHPFPPTLTVERGPTGGPVRIPGLRWARLNFGGENKRWHAVVGLWAICHRQRFDYPRVEYSASKPETGTLCKYCLTVFEKGGV
jgi:hypothetical protein